MEGRWEWSRCVSVGGETRVGLVYYPPPPQSPPGRQDNCPLVSNPNQAKSYCSLTTDVTCGSACAFGCSAAGVSTPTDTTNTFCTNPINKKGKQLTCKRCKSGFHPLTAGGCAADASGTTYDCKTTYSS